VIAWLAGVAFAGGTAGVQLGAVAAARSAAPPIDGQLGLWASVAPRPWGLAVEGTAWHRVDGAKPWDDGSLYQFATVQARGAVYAEVALGTHATTFHAGLGPALTLTDTRVRSAGRDVRDRALDPGVAGRIAVDGPIVGALGWQWRVGLASRGLRAVDLDSALGLGVAW
jgi:hypothetical protein